MWGETRKNKWSCNHGNDVSMEAVDGEKRVMGMVLLNNSEAKGISNLRLCDISGHQPGFVWKSREGKGRGSAIKKRMVFHRKGKKSSIYAFD